MVLVQLQSLKEETQTSSGGASLIDFTKLWNQPAFSGETVGVQEANWHEVKLPIYDTVDNSELERISHAVQDLLGVTPIVSEDDLLIDEPIPTKPVKTIKVKARIGQIHHIKVSRPLYDSPDEYLIDE